MTYRAAAVDPSLRPYVRRILIQDSDGDRPGPGVPYKVLPQPYPVLGFQYRGRLDVLRGSRTSSLERSGITGLQTAFRLFVPRADARSILVQLKPQGAYALLGCAMDDVTDQHIGLSSIVSDTAARAVEEQLAETTTFEQRSQVMQSFLTAQLEGSGRRPHPVVTEAVQRILRTHGAARVASLAGDLGVSERHLERLFQTEIGVSPKRLASLAQFDWARARISSLPTARLAGEAGYADQAHFIRTFRAYSGVTPGRYRPQPLPR